MGKRAMKWAWPILVGLLCANPSAQAAEHSALTKKLVDTRECVACDLNGQNLSNLDLSGVDLSKADLGEANLKGTNLSGANLVGANL